MNETEVETDSSQNTILKTTPIIRDLSLNPSCDHGPSILFERNGTRFFACSAFRCRKLCPFYMSEEKWEELKSNSGAVQEGRCERYLEEGLESNSGRPLHKKFKYDETANHPLSSPKQQDKGEAQYHFNETTVEFFITQLKCLEIDSILCIGTPSLHHHMSATSRSSDYKSFLLDIDKRFVKLYEQGFSLYNMCNHHFFQDNAKYLDFLMNSRKLAVILDPPFGVKVDLIWHGCIQGIQRDLLQLRNQNDGNNAGNHELDFEVMWIFPYFMEGHILKCSAAKLEMSDFHIEYRNHSKYKANATGSKSSPIRIFTTIPLSQMSLPKKDYRYCNVCTKWVDKRNAHCKFCATCTTKDGGGTYVHCKICKKCAKPTWKHCSKCRTCHLANSKCKKNIMQNNLQNAISKPDTSFSKRNIRYNKKRNKKR